MADKEIGTLMAGTSAGATNFHGVESGNSRRFTGAEIARSGFSGVLVIKSATQSISSGVSTALTWASATIDTDSYWSAGSPSRLTAPAAGYYIIGGNVDFASNSTSVRGAFLWKNGAGFDGMGYHNQPAVNGMATRINVGAGPVLLALGDYIELMVSQASGVALNVASGSTVSFSMMRVG